MSAWQSKVKPSTFFPSSVSCSPAQSYFFLLSVQRTPGDMESIALMGRVQCSEPCGSKRVSPSWVLGNPLGHCESGEFPILARHVILQGVLKRTGIVDKVLLCSLLIFHPSVPLFCPCVSSVHLFVASRDTAFPLSSIFLLLLCTATSKDSSEKPRVHSAFSYLFF